MKCNPSVSKLSSLNSQTGAGSGMGSATGKEFSFLAPFLWMFEVALLA